MSSNGSNADHLYSLLLDLQILSIFCELLNPKLSIAFQIQPLQCSNSLDLMVTVFLMQPSIGLPLLQEDFTTLIFRLAFTVTPGAFRRAVTQTASFQLYFCMRLFFPGTELCNSPYWASGNSSWPSFTSFSRLLWIKTRSLSVSTFLPFSTVLIFSGK